jgi:trehalose 6-phosphate phosphatase
MTEYFFTSSYRHTVINALRDRPRILAFDFDGTLVTIENNPHIVSVPDIIISLLSSLTEKGGTTVAIISGRRLSELKQLINIPSLILYGNHGLESSGKNMGAPRSKFIQWSDTAKQISEALSYLPSRYSGCFIENKGPVVAIHMRNMNQSFRKDVVSAVKDTARTHEFSVRAGKMVIEAVPNTHFNKGTALAEIAALHYGKWEKNNTIMFAGDDRTDEDVFKIIKRFGMKSFGFKIGNGKTDADFRLKEKELPHLMEIII